MARLDKERQQKLEPQRINNASKKITELGLDIVQRDSTKIVFMFNGQKVQFFPYSGWHTGKTIKDGRGLDNLLKQLKPKEKNKKFSSDTIQVHHTIGLKPWGKYTIKQIYDILEAWAYCDDEDKSTEFMLQYMSDSSKVPYDNVVEYLASNRSGSDRKKYYKRLSEIK